jgi:hypothetical protein
MTSMASLVAFEQRLHENLGCDYSNNQDYALGSVKGGLLLIDYTSVKPST